MSALAGLSLLPLSACHAGPHHGGMCGCRGGWSGEPQRISRVGEPGGPHDAEAGYVRPEGHDHH
jgi:hypothetical protein